MVLRWVLDIFKVGFRRVLGGFKMLLRWVFRLVSSWCLGCFKVVLR